MKILLIEDDEILSNALKRGLEIKGFSVDQVFDGEKGQKRILLHGDTYDLIILDFILPTIHGDEVCRNVRARGFDNPILMLTGKNKIEDKVHSLNWGADDYLTKPFSMEELIARIHALLRRPRKAVATELVAGDIVLNPLTRKVLKKGKEIPLTLKEFGILEYFMRNCNQVIMRDQLLDHLWDFNFSSFSNVIDVYINKLRKKLYSKDTSILETIRGVGYRLNT